MSSLKIVILTPGLCGGGAERVSSILANGLARSGNSVTVICAYSDSQDYEMSSKVEIVQAISKKPSIFGLLDRNIKIYKLLKSIEPDVVLSFVLGDAVLAESHGIPFIQTLRNDPWHDGMTKPHRVLRLIAYSLAKGVIFQTERAMMYFPERIHNKGVLLSNPVCVDAIPFWHRDMKAKRIISAGRLEPQKNFEMLINAFSLFHANHQDYTLDIYGDGTKREELQRLINSLGLSDAVNLAGRTSELFKHMSCASIFALSSDYEGVSNVMLEALCMGMPCVVTDHSPGGARQYIRDGENGFLIPVGDSHSMAGRFAELAENWELAYELGNNAIATRALVSEDSVVSQWQQVLLNVSQ